MITSNGKLSPRDMNEKLPKSQLYVVRPQQKKYIEKLAKWEEEFFHVFGKTMPTFLKV